MIVYNGSLHVLVVTFCSIFIISSDVQLGAFRYWNVRVSFGVSSTDLRAFLQQRTRKLYEPVTKRCEPYCVESDGQRTARLRTFRLLGIIDNRLMILWRILSAGDLGLTLYAFREFEGEENIRREDG